MDVMTLAAKLTLNTSEFDANLSSSEKEMKGMTSGGVAWGNIISQAVTKAARATLNFGKNVIQVGADFDTAMSQVKALGQLENDDFIRVRKRAMELGESTKFTAAQVAEAFSYMALAGWDTDEMLAGIDGVLNLAAASGEDLGRTSDIVTDAITAMGLTAKDSSHFVDVLAQASANSNTTVAQMGEAFKYLATTGGVLDYSIEDVATTLGLLANNGIKASQAGTSMRQILNTLINPTDKAALAMEKLGISLFDPETNARKPLAQVLQEFRDVFKDAGLQLEEGFDPAEIQKRLDDLNAWYDEQYAHLQFLYGDKNKKAYKDLDKEYEARFADEITPNQSFLAALGDIGGLRGISSLFAIMNSTDEDFEQLTKAINDSEGAAGEMAETMLDNLEGDITILNSAMEGLKIVVSDSFKEQLRSFVQTLTEEIGNLNEAFQENGVLGMFVNLADWVINGITDALTDASVTGEGATKFGTAIGDFVGRTVAHLVEKAPELISGLFNAGINLAGGLIEGLFAGLFGTGEGTVPGMILSAEQMEADALKQATASSTQAKGILEYMDSLKQKYGDAAENTEEWATALERLKSVYPEINQFIAEEGGNLSATNASLMEYIENNNRRIEQEAKKKALQKYIDAYSEAQQAQTSAEIEREIALSEAGEARSRLVSYVSSHAGNEDFTGKGLTFEQVEFAARSVANEFGESQTEIDALSKVYNENKTKADEAGAKIEELSQSTVLLKAAMDNAESALAKLEASAGSFTTYGQWANDHYSKNSNAKGLWDVPYDDYVSTLHRGEMVLNATRAREYREGGTNTSLDLDSLTAAVETAIRAGMEGATVRSYLNGRDITDEVNRTQIKQLKARRYAT